MRHLLAASAIIVAMSGAAGAQETGGSSPKDAVDKFVAAANAQDIKAMGRVWGSSGGAVLDQMERTEMEQRELIMMRCLRHDSYKVVNDRPSTNGDRILSVELSRKSLTRPSDFVATKGPESRWYVQTADLNALKDLCTQP